MDKKTVREMMKTKLQHFTEAEYDKKSSMIHNKLINLKPIKEAQTIAVTISNFPEVNTKALIEMLWKLGKNVAIPRCVTKTREMEFYIFTSYEQLETVYLNIQEPIINATKKIMKESIDVIIVPGRVYDRRGYRVGFGGGYYDRYVSDFQKALISMAFEVQIVEKVPVEKYDIPVCTIVTEEHIYNCSDTRKGENQ